MMAPKPLFLRLSIALLSLLVLQLLVWRFSPTDQAFDSANGLSLKAPPFVKVAKAEDAAITAIGDEAGISAWYQAPSTIDLQAMRSQFRTIERETGDYIIGSVPVAGYLELQDVHLYVHKDGWLLAYYMAAVPAGKIFDWQAYEDSNGSTITTKLENTIATVLSTVGIAFTGATYYDFRYPNATRMMIIAENNENVDESFTINLPGTFIFFERSWFIGSDGTIYLNSNELGHDYDNGRDNNQGIITQSQMAANTSHIVTVHYGYGGLVLIYREQ